MKIYDWRKFTTFLAIVMLLVVVCLSQCTKKEPQLKEVQEYVVESGDTLWSIGTEFRPTTMSIQQYIYNLQQANNIGSVIYPNQVIQVLIYEEA